MATTSRRLSEKVAPHRPSHTDGKTKGGFCVKPKDAATATAGNPYKGAGLKGNQRATYDRLWARYKSAKGNS